MIPIAVERLIPHRERMKLVDEIIHVDNEMAVSLSTVTNQWPLQDGLFVSALILIELMAQTSAITIGWKELKKNPNSPDGKGWLVGIKSASFHLDKIPVQSRITTRSVISIQMDHYTEMHGYSTIGDIPVGEAVLQVMRAEREDDSDESGR